MVALALFMLRTTRQARHWWWALVLRLVGVISRLMVVGIKVPAMEVNVAAVVARVTEVTVLMVTKSLCPTRDLRCCLATSSSL